MNNSFLTVAASYYGLSPDNVAYSDWTNDNGEMVVTFAVRPTDDDVLGILSRMKAMREEEAQRQCEQHPFETKSDEELREEYEGMTQRSKSKYGSFARYKAACFYDAAVASGAAPVTSNADDFGGLPG